MVGPQMKYHSNAYRSNEEGTPIKNNSGFRVPNTTRVPRSAQSAGYYTASSLSSDTFSQHSLNTSNSQRNHY